LRDFPDIYVRHCCSADQIVADSSVADYLYIHLHGSHFKGRKFAALAEFLIFVLTTEKLALGWDEAPLDANNL
jgi:hypothetical protein